MFWDGELFLTLSHAAVAAGYTLVAVYAMKLLATGLVKPVDYIHRLLLIVAVTYFAWAILEWHAVFILPSVALNLKFWTIHRAMHVPIILVGWLVNRFIERCWQERMVTRDVCSRINGTSKKDKAAV